MKYRYRTDDEMKDSGVEWLGKIPKEWEKTKIKYVSDSKKFAIVDGPFGTQLKADEYIEEGVPLIRITNLSYEGKLSDKNLVYIREAKAFELKRSSIVIGDIVIGKTGATIGKTGLNLNHNFAIIASSCLKLSPNLKNNRSEFVSYFIQSKIFQKNLLETSNGSTRDTINIEPFKNIEALKISYQEQQKIASFLDKKTDEFDDIIEKKQSLITKLAEAKKSLISEVVTGKKEVIFDNGHLTIRDRADNEMKDSGNIFYKKIPKQWIISKFKHISNQIIDGSHFTPTYVSEGVPFLRVTDITKGQLKDINMDEVMFIPEEEHKELIKRCKPEKGDLLVSKNGTIGIPKVIDWDWEFSIFVSLCLIKLKEKINPYLLSYYFKSGLFDNQIAYSGKTTSITNLHLDKIREFFIIIQSNKEQQLIVDFLDKKTAKIDSTIEKIKLQIEKLKEAKQSLISEAVTGKIEVLD